MKGLGSFLREIREEKNLTLTDVYKKTGITDSRLSRIETESGKYSPPIADVIKLAELYNIDYAVPSDNVTLIDIKDYFNKLK